MNVLLLCTWININVRVPSLEDEGLNLAGFVHGRPPGHGLSVVWCDLHDSALRMCVLKERGARTEKELLFVS